MGADRRDRRHLGGAHRVGSDVEADATGDAISRAPVQVGVDVALTEPVATPHPGRPQVTRLDQPVHGHVQEHAGTARDLSHRQ